MSDKPQSDSAIVSQNDNAHLLAAFMDQHRKSASRSGSDIQDCATAQQTDQDTITALSSPNPNKSKIAGLLSEDIRQDQQAAGNGNHPGADQKNAALDDQIVATDWQLSMKPDLTAEQRDALAEDIRTHSLDAKYSRADIATEQKYIQHDRALITALQTGRGIDEAKAAVIADRQGDIANENLYIDNDKAMSASNQKVLKLFGNLAISK
jgi:hypothetical protein